MKEKIIIEDESNDRKYFTMLPNYILNHSTAVDQALYMQMKKVAGENGKCFLSERKLMDKLGVGEKALKKSIAYLIGRGWIKESGFVIAQTKGGPQKVKAYTIIDIWKLNVEHYEQGASESGHLSKGASESSKVLSKVAKGASESGTNKNPIIKTIEEDTSEQARKVDLTSQLIKEMESVDIKNKRYYGNTTQREAVKFMIDEYGYDLVEKVIKALPKMKATIPYFPSITTPCELRDKWVKMKDAVDREKLKNKPKEVLFA